MISGKPQKVKKYTITLGMNDKITYEQELDTEKILRVVSNCCKQYGLCYSCVIQTGGYIHENGKFVAENSIVLTFINQDKYWVDELAKDICCFIHQESVLVTEEDIVCYFVSDDI